MAIGLADIYEKLKELIIITDKVRENTERIVKLENEVHGLKEEFRMFHEEFRLRDAEMRGELREVKGDVRAILNRPKRRNISPQSSIG